MESRERALVRKIRILTGRRIDTLFSGEYHSAFRGMGLLFDRVREYQDGDDVRTIDWNVSSRLNHLYVRQYIEERQLSMVIAVDVSASTLFGGSGTKRDTMMDTAAILLYLAERNHDNVSVLLFSDRIERFIRPGKGRSVMLRVLDEILAVEPSGKGTDIPGAADFLGRVLKKRSVVFLLSDFLDGGDDYLHKLRLLGRRHDIIPVRVYDPLEKPVPFNGLVQFRDLETGRICYSSSLPGGGMPPADDLGDHITISTGESPAMPILRFFEKRGRTRFAAHGRRRAI